MAKMTCEISVIGFLTVRASDESRPITPRGAKARGMIGLLCLSPDFCRSRVWLQSKLWSSRSETQAQGSLRQALSEIRRALGQYADLITADREKIWLERDKIFVDLIDNREEALSRLRGGSELMEGLHVRDEEFEDWLRLERSCLHSLGPDPASTLLHREVAKIVSSDDYGSKELSPEMVVANVVAKYLTYIAAKKNESERQESRAFTLLR